MPYGSLFTSTTVARPVGWHYLGMLAATFGQHDIGAEHLALAIEAHERVRAPLFLAETKLELARVVLEMEGRTSDATSLLGDVRATAAAHGSPFLARRCAEVEDA